jgi:TolB protein
MKNSWVAIAAAAAFCLCQLAVAAEPAGLIAFSSNRSGPWRICTVRPDGSDLRELSKGAPDEQDVDPVFSPDGKQVLFTSTRGGTAGIWKMSIDGGKPERICDGDQAEWSPDGKKIALRKKEQIVVRDLAGGSEKSISPKDWPHCSGPAWSRDGKMIAFACRWDEGNAAQRPTFNSLFLVSADGGEPITVYDKKGACEPHWSPDGKRLVYETETNICTIDPDGKKNRPVTFFGGVQRYGRFSPDGKMIVYCQGESEQGPWELYTIPALGGTPTKITEGASDMTPDWK